MSLSNKKKLKIKTSKSKTKVDQREVKRRIKQALKDKSSEGNSSNIVRDGSFLQVTDSIDQQINVTSNVPDVSGKQEILHFKMFQVEIINVLDAPVRFMISVNDDNKIYMVTSKKSIKVNFKQFSTKNTPVFKVDILQHVNGKVGLWMDIKYTFERKLVW